MKEKFRRKWRLLLADLSSVKGLFCFVCSVLAGSFLIGAMFTGAMFFLASYSLTQLPTHELGQLKSMTIAQLLPVVKPTVHEYMQWVICTTPVMSLLCEVARSIRHQERLLAAV